MTKFCRTCAESIENENFRNLFGKDKDISKAMVLQINIVTRIKLTNDPQMPSYICQCCLWDLKQALAFRERCLNAQKLLVERWQQELLLNEEESELKLTAAKSLLLEDDFDEDSYQNADFDEILTDIINDETTMFNDEGQYDQIQSACDEFVEKTNSLSYTENIKQHTKPLKQMTASKDITKSKKSRRKKNSMTDPLPSVCEKCGKTFANRSNLKEHLLRHLGIRKYQCPLCSYKSYTDHLLRRHLIKHGDKRPYACKYCDKTFRSGSGRHDHEKTHTVNGPFQCNHCERTFTTDSGRIRHEALHTHIRTFQCEICNISFVWRRHLEQHNRCKSHKRAEFKASIHISECSEELLEPADHVS